MRKIILNLAISLDGFIEGPNGEYDWCFTDQDYGMSAFYDDTDAIFIGRKSYELISADPNAFPEKKLYVFSDSLPEGENPVIEVIRSADFEESVNRVANEPGKSIWLFGGSQLASAFISKNLIGELLLSVHPVILGKGKPLFQNIQEKLDLILIGQQVYDSGLVQLRYALKPKFDMEMLKLL